MSGDGLGVVGVGFGVGVGVVGLDPLFPRRGAFHEWGQIQNIEAQGPRFLGHCLMYVFQGIGREAQVRQ